MIERFVRNEEVVGLIPICSTSLRSPSYGETGQYRLPFCCIKSNLAVSATAMTAMTPAWTGSLTTRSAASGTLPAMFSEITWRPLRRTSSTARVI